MTVVDQPTPAIPTPHDTTSPIIMSWVGQILDPFIQTLVEHHPDQQIEITLRASNGRVRANPTVTFNAGPQKMIEPGA